VEQSVTARILVVEDDADLLDVLASALRGLGHEVIEAHHGREALDLLAHMSRPNMILLDLMMPVMNGAEFLAALDDDAKTIPVVVMTAQPDAAAAVAGTPTVLLKPVGLHNLMTTIARVLRTSAAVHNEGAGWGPPVNEAHPIATGTPPTGIEAQPAPADAAELNVEESPAMAGFDAVSARPDGDATAAPVTTEKAD
jgi:CheY-like chemotaxis protein